MKYHNLWNSSFDLLVKNTISEKDDLSSTWQGPHVGVGSIISTPTRIKSQQHKTVLNIKSSNKGIDETASLVQFLGFDIPDNCRIELAFINCVWKWLKIKTERKWMLVQREGFLSFSTIKCLQRKICGGTVIKLSKSRAENYV